MKKLSVLLLILTLVSAMPMDMVNALETGKEQGAITEPGARVTTELPVVHELDQRMHIQRIDPREGLIEIEVMSPIGEQLQAQRVWFATMDYENGWTEAEVDELLDDWTTLEAEWTKVTKEQSFTGALLHFYRTISLTIEGTRLQYDLTTVNLPDVLYYATEFRDLANEDAGTFWVRGKVDYRGCVHAQRFRDWQTGACVEMTDWDAGTTKYWAADSTEDEAVVTWEEEWRLVLAGRLREIGTVLDGLVMVPDLPKEALAQGLSYEDEKLTRVEVLLAKATGVEEEVAEAGRLRERMARMLNGSSEGTGNESSSGGNSGTLGGSSAESSNTSDLGVGEGIELGVSGEGAGSDDNSDISSENGLGSDAGSSIGDSVGNLGSPDFGSGSVLLDNNVEEAAEGLAKDLDGFKEVAGAKTVGDELEVPKLGGAKVNRDGWAWWVIGVSGVLALFLGVALKRKQRK